MVFFIIAIVLSVYLCIGLCIFDWPNKRYKALMLSLEIVSLVLFGINLELQKIRHVFLNGAADADLVLQSFSDGGTNLQLFLCTHEGVQFMSVIELVAIVLQIVVLGMCLKNALKRKR